MKAKIKLFFKTVFLLIGGIIFCLGLYYLFDETFNGVFLDWFSNRYMTTYTSYSDENWVVTEPRWGALKNLIFLALCAVVLTMLILIQTISRFRAKRAVHAAVTEASRFIKSYMEKDTVVSDIFPKEYAEISAQMAELKSTMQRHEQILKDEASRKNDLITYLAHDLKTPLTSVIGYLSLLEEAPDMPQEQKAKYLHITLDKAQRLERLINEFFDITRYNLQEIYLEKERVDLYYMLVQMTDEFYPILSAHGNTIDLKADENLTVFADPERLARVFNNILKNAVAYSYPGTPITIQAGYLKGSICISIQNRGKTIPRQKLDSIFEKFFRLDDARSSNTGGAGLGLAIAREIVRLHGGTITAESDHEITSFRVQLPILRSS